MPLKQIEIPFLETHKCNKYKRCTKGTQVEWDWSGGSNEMTTTAPPYSTSFPRFSLLQPPLFHLSIYFSFPHLIPFILSCLLLSVPSPLSVSPTPLLSFFLKSFHLPPLCSVTSLRPHHLLPLLLSCLGPHPPAASPSLLSLTSSPTLYSLNTLTQCFIYLPFISPSSPLPLC